MSPNAPTKTPDVPPTKAVDNKPAPEKQDKPDKIDRYSPDMPAIPGVDNASQQASGAGGMPTQRLFQIVLGAAIVLIGTGAFWMVSKKPGASANPPATANSEVAQLAPSAPEPVNPVPAAPEELNVAATVDDLAKPWDAKKFIFTNPLTTERIDAMVVRLPGDALWAFSLQVQFSRCELEYVTDQARLASEFHYRATHPMVVSSCDGTVYDPLKVGPLGADTWVRGEIVRGNALRPPISIEVKTSGRNIIADRIE